MTKKLKKMTVSDVKILQELSITTFTDTFAAGNTAENMKAYLSEAYTIEKLTDELTNSESTFYFIYFEEQLAGYLKLNVGSTQTESILDNGLEVERIYILSQFKRHGLGRFLIETAIDMARKQGKEIIWLGVWDQNPKARAFYESLGFEYFSAHTFVMGDDPQTDLIMVKNLVK
ncbi:GNAT family N-acetyltransferase [Enterococcus alishanensis]|uniref:GNAT family N-acetyltransferase n=1 Tax=Enterococcus alishanensis TaxID=1303817 RepID=A0ABS6TFF6_9ENTE|nr:GNAT family N-acetyltransferase [Enterococcus alishanensis]MBV7391682.1 GNAT family N-acetyltransferase [Enterococcus alishanensis]